MFKPQKFQYQLSIAIEGNSLEDLKNGFARCVKGFETQKLSLDAMFSSEEWTAWASVIERKYHPVKVEKQHLKSLPGTESILDLSKPDYVEEFVSFLYTKYRNTGIPSGHIPDKPGIYVFAAKVADGQSPEILYIGKAKFLRNRILQYGQGVLHQRIIDPILKYVYQNEELDEEIHFAFNVYCFLVEEPELIERRLIQLYKPRFNKQFNVQKLQDGNKTSLNTK